MRTLTGLGVIVILAAGVTAATTAYGTLSSREDPKRLPLQQVADMLHAVIEADRMVYTTRVVNRLQNDEKVIVADEHFTDKKVLPLPVQLFQFGAERVAEKTDSFSYTLRSIWPINKENAPRTEAESAGLKAVAADRSKPFYKEETLGGKRYFTAVYADVAVFPGCVSCHNGDDRSPRRDYKLDETMGGLVIRLPID